MALDDISFAGQNADTGFPAHLQPTQGKNLYSGNYLDFFNLSGGGQWAQQFLPDVYEKEAEIYGNRTISSFLRMVSAEMPSTSDQIIWLEQGRLHTRYSQLNFVSTSPTAITIPTAALTAASGVDRASSAVTAGHRLAFVQSDDAEPGPTSETDTTEQDNRINFRVGQTVMVQKSTGGTAGRGTGPVFKGVVTQVNGFAFEMSIYKSETLVVTADDKFTALVYGSEFAKGTGNFTEKLDPSYSTYSNKPIIMKEHYSINGSDTTQIGWIEVTSENGASGYLWYIKSEHENRLRWEDYMEMSMLEAVPQDGTGANLGAFRDDFGFNFTQSGTSPFAVTQNTSSGQTQQGTQGLFDAIETRGNVYDGLAEDLFSATTAADNGIVALTDTFDVILKQHDRNGAIEEHMLYVNRDLALAFDNFLATQNNYGGSSGVSWGVFNNAKDMAIDLGFSGFRRGSYDFYKTDWKYLNDHATRGGFGDIQGIMVPAGMSTVYDQGLGKNIKRPFLHVRYRSSETENRKMKSWITGSVGGAYTTDVDEMRMHYLTERCIITQGANNFFLLKQETGT